MTVASEVNKAIFLGSGSAGPFTFGFKFFVNTEISVTKTGTDDVETILGEGDDYVLTGAGVDTGGSVTLTVALEVGETIEVLRELDMLQETSFVNQGAFYPELHEGAFDRVVMMIQQVYNYSQTLWARVADMQAAFALFLFNLNGQFIKTSVSASSFGTDISDAITGIGASNATLVVDSPITVDNSSTIPANISLRIDRPGFLTVATGEILTINGAFAAGLYQVFVGGGTVTGLKELRPEWFETNVTPGTTNMSDAANAAFAAVLASGGGKVTFTPGQKYRLDTTVLVDGGNDNNSIIEIDAATSEFYFYGTGGAFQFLDAVYPKAKLGKIFINGDTAGTYGIHLKHCRWGTIDAEIFYGLTTTAAAWATDNTAFYLESGPTNAYDNLYNHITGRARHTGWSVWLENLDTAYTRNNANEFDIEYQGTNGIKIRGCDGNTFRGSLESGTGSPISLLLNDDGVKTRYNTFDFRWVENAAMDAWNPVADAGCDDNVFFVRNLQYGTFAIPGRQQITYNGNDGTTNDTTHLIQSLETEQAQLAGGYMGGVNLLGATDDFSNAAWTKSNVTVSAGAVALPDGTTVSDKNTITLGSANGSVNQTITYDTANKRLTASVWLKASTPHVARFQIYSNAGGGAGNTKYVYVTTSWRRYHLTYNFSATAGTSVGLYIYPAYTGVATGVINVFGPQLNEGYPGAYMGGGTNAAARKLGTCGQIGTNNAVVTPLIGFSKYQDTGAYNNNYRIIGYATAAPSAGTWVAGDRLFHSSPEEAGTAGSKYIIDGWACTASGTPGTWVQCRTLTGN